MNWAWCIWRWPITPKRKKSYSARSRSCGASSRRGDGATFPMGRGLEPGMNNAAPSGRKALATGKRLAGASGRRCHDLALLPAAGDLAQGELYRRTLQVPAASDQRWRCAEQSGASAGRANAVQGSRSSFIARPSRSPSRSWDPAHPDVAVSLSSLAKLHDRAAQILRRRAAAPSRRTNRPAKLSAGPSAHRLRPHQRRRGGGRTQTLCGRRTLYRQSEAILEKALPPNHPELGKLLPA